MKYLRYLEYIVKHKFFVMIECFKVGLLRQGITHDLSKFLPSEFFPYANFFYGKKIERRDKTGYYRPTDTGDRAFDLAWLYHQNRNKHHWQFWLLSLDDGGHKALDMSMKYRKEMLADWKGAGRAQGKPDTNAWYQANKGKMILGPETREWIETSMQRLHTY